MAPSANIVAFERPPAATRGIDPQARGFIARVVHNVALAYALDAPYHDPSEVRDHVFA